MDRPSFRPALSAREKPMRDKNQCDLVQYGESSRNGSKTKLFFVFNCTHLVEINLPVIEGKTGLYKLFVLLGVFQLILEQIT